MALFSLDVRIVSRKRGANILRHVAYRAAERLRDHTAARHFDYTSKSDVVHREIVTPLDAPGWMRDREKLWNAAQACEKRRDAQLAQDLFVAIPRSVLPQHRARLIREFVQDTFVSRGMVADFAIHNPIASDGHEFPHAHITLTTRCITNHEQGFGNKLPNWSHPKRIWEIRANWETHVNRNLERSGTLVRVDRRSRREQRREIEAHLAQAIVARDRPKAQRLALRAAELEPPPMPSLGRAASAMEKRGRATEAGDRVRQWRALWTVDRMRARKRQRLREVNRAMRQAAIQNLMARTKLQWVKRFEELLHPLRTTQTRAKDSARDHFVPEHLPPQIDPTVTDGVAHAREVVERLLHGENHEPTLAARKQHQLKLRDRIDEMLSGQQRSASALTSIQHRPEIDKAIRPTAKDLPPHHER